MSVKLGPTFSILVITPNSSEPHSPIMDQLVDRFKRAIEEEQKADTDDAEAYLRNYSPKKLARLGLAITNLVLASTRTGLGGKTVMEFELDLAVKDKGIEPGLIRTGDIVKVSNHGDKVIDFTAVVVKITPAMVVVSTDDEGAEVNDDVRCWMAKVANSVTYRRMTTAMNKLSELRDTDKPDVIRLVLGESQFTPPPPLTQPPVFFNPHLNQLQQDAVDFALRSPITIIHGPPGTGKTYTVIELIKQLVAKGERVLVCGPLNISVDTILERLSGNLEAAPTSALTKTRRALKKKQKQNDEKIIRIGHPARLLELNLRHSLDVLLSSTGGGDNRELLVDIANEITSTWGQIRKCKKYSERRQLYGELKELKREMRAREKSVVSDLITHAKVVVSTLHGAAAYELTSLYKNDALHLGPDLPLFDTIIIDEVSQLLEPQCWVPLVNHLGCKRLVIAGDNQQLPPTVKLAKALETTLFDRLMTIGGDQYRKLLDVQYRMNRRIMEFPSTTLYDGKLRADSSVENITIDHVPVLVWYDTQGGDFEERVEDDLAMSTGSKYNEMEAVVVWNHVAELLQAGVAATDIGIISPYNAQVQRLRRLVPAAAQGVEISTVDGFQGREKEVIIMLLVRSNNQGEVGFLRDQRRLNVAITRAKRHLCVVGDLDMLARSREPFLTLWAADVESHYDIRYPDPSETVAESLDAAVAM